MKLGDEIIIHGGVYAGMRGWIDPKGNMTETKASVIVEVDSGGETTRKQTKINKTSFTLKTSFTEPAATKKKSKKSKKAKAKAKPKKKQPTPWRYSEAKALLTQDIIDGFVEPDMPPSDVFFMRPEYAEYEYDKFVTNLCSLQKSLTGMQELADADEAALSHDLEFGVRSSHKRWQGSYAERCLKFVIAHGLHLVMKPKQLHKIRPEYQEWPLTIFHDHIHQELRSGMERPYWLAKQQEKLEKKRRKEKKSKKLKPPPSPIC